MEKKYKVFYQGSLYGHFGRDRAGKEIEINFNGHYKGELGPWQAASIITSTAELDFGEPGRHILRFRFVDPGIVLEKIMIDFGGLQKNYLGAPSSELIK